MKIGLLIPAYNERKQLPFLLSEIQKVFSDMREEFEIIIVDDGSEDGTKEFLAKEYSGWPLTVLSHIQNRGVSEAFKTGFDYIMDKKPPFDLMITMEANKNADPSIIPVMLNSSEKADLVLASCYAPGGAVVGDPIHRYVMSKGINWLLSKIFPCNDIHTYTSFYRLWKIDVLKWLKKVSHGTYFKQEGFVCMADALLKICHNKAFDVVEVPFVLVSDILDDGSKMNVVKTIKGYLKLIFTNLWLSGD